MKTFWSVAGSLGILGALALSGCANASPWSPTQTQTTGWIDLDGVSTKCDNGNRIYANVRRANPVTAIAVVAADPTC